MKGEGERERYTQLNQSSREQQGEIRKPSLKMQIEENNRMGKTRDLIKKIGAIKGIFHARMGTMKDRNSKDLTEVEEI